MKDWNNLSDKELDRLFRDSADRNLPAADTAAWEAMASKLDKNKGYRPGKNIIYSIAILLLFTFGYGTYKYLDSDLKLESTDLNQAVILNGSESEELNSAFQSTIEQQQHEKIQNNENFNIADESIVENFESKTSQKVDFIYDKQVNQDAENQILLEEEATGSIINDALEENFSNNENLQIGISLKVGPAFLVSKEFNYYNYEVKLPRQIESTENVMQSIAPKKKWAIRLAFSPDFSAVPDNDFYKIGHNIAFLLEYQLNSRWSIQTGVIKSLKFYAADSEAYDWPDAWGAKPPQLNQVEARCNMLDIPINIRYDFKIGDFKWFAQTGVTSYLMLKETYDYVYNSSYSSQKWNTWEGKTGFYPAGVINFSMGVEKRIFKNMTFQAEPFVKIPIAGVGYGDVKLMTLGLFLSTKVPLNFR